jgi:hypothetical protein
LGGASTSVPIESLKDVIIVLLRLCTVTGKLLVEPRYDLRTLEVVKIAAAAKLISGPNDSRAALHMNCAQYIDFGACLRKNTGPTQSMP